MIKSVVTRQAPVDLVKNTPEKKNVTNQKWFTCLCLQQVVQHR